MNRNAISNRTPLAAIGPQAYELTDAELNGVSGGNDTSTKQAGTTAQENLRISLENILTVSY
jgi:hypothetical protein